MKIKSKALEVNIADYYVDVAIDPKYAALQEVISKYYGLMDGLNTFLKELSHPYKNWQFIVTEARGYALNYYHLFLKHPRGVGASELMLGIFNDAIESAGDKEVKQDAVDNLLLYLQKIITDSGPQIKSFMPVLNAAFDRIRAYDKAYFFLFLKSYYQIKKLAEAFLKNRPDAVDGFSAVNRLTIHYFRQTYAYWLSEGDPLTWFEQEVADTDDRQKLAAFFAEISHRQLRNWNQQLSEIAGQADLDSDQVLQQLLVLPGYAQIVQVYRDTPLKLHKTASDNRQGNRWKVIFLFHIMNISGLSLIHEEALREINRTLSWLISHESHLYIRELIQKTFSILKARTGRYPEAVLNCVLNMGKGVYKTDESDLVNFFIDSVIDLGFQSPMISGVGDDWQVKANSAHIQNTRTWLDLIELNPKWSHRLISNLIIHLSLSGVYIKDTDLFPRDITRFLNCDIGPVYNLTKQLARLFPVYFNDIGAEGKLRDISTQLDEISHRKDRLIHFLRKQSHVESSNRIIGFMEAIFEFWKSGIKTVLKPFVPPEIYNDIRVRGSFIDGVHSVVSQLDAKGLAIPEDLLSVDESRLLELLQGIPDVSDMDLKRVELAVALYKLLNQKYNLDFIEIENYIEQLKPEAFPDIKRLKDAMAESGIKKKLVMLLDYLGTLKQLILSSQTYEVREDIYKKRHFTIDIPSLYGSYHEMKFDALGLTFRLEHIVNVLFEEIIENIDLSLITKATFYQIYARLRLFDKALSLDGISSVEIERQLDLLAHSLEVKGFTFTQYLDIFKGFAQAVKNIINDYFNNIHERNLSKILPQIPADQFLPKYVSGDGSTGQGEKLKHRVSEIFFRERIALSLGLQQLDVFLSRILNTLFHQSDLLRKEKLHHLLLYDPENAMTPIEGASNRVSGMIYLGNKGHNLVRLKDFGFPVPPGFIITTEVFRFRDVIESYPPAEQNFREQLAQNIALVEKSAGKSFGDPKNPLVFSVRSGSSISQPGMMDTYLDVGINEEIAAALALRFGNSWFAWDCYRRYLQCYGMSFGLKRDDFDAIISDFKQKLGIPLKKGFTGEQMRKTALTYKDMIQSSAIDIVETPFEQLQLAIKSVFDSWNSSKAKTYRKIMGISDDWGTAVTVQAMVYGNMSQLSGTGVFFTHNPRWSGDSLRLWGDFTLENQGEDVVSGLVNTLPISIFQQDIEMRNTDITLESHFPEIYKTLKVWANFLIYEKGWSPQEMEFTFESPSAKDLYLLQTRDMSVRAQTKVATFSFEEISDDRIIGHGIGVSGDAMRGRVVFTLEEIDKWRCEEPETSLILLRSDTVPDDIREIYAADGLLTARGGLTSHAAVVAHRLGKTCIVGCGNLVCNEKEKQCRFHEILINSGEHISIDGREGTVYRGALKVIRT